MKLTVKICCAILALAGLAGCAVDEHPVSETATVRLKLSADSWQARTFDNPGTNNVDRILVIPFEKNGDDPEPDKNFVAVSSGITQIDVAAFPLEDLTLKLLRGQTYNILILGYNSADYDYADPGSAANNFALEWIDGQSLWDLSLDANVAGNRITVPEIFSGFATSGGNEQFVADDNLTVACTLKRISAGISITLGNIPTDVTSLALTCDTIASSVWIGRGGVSGSMLEGETITSYTIASAVLGGDGSPMFDAFLLNSTDDTGTPLPMQFAIEILFDDATTAVYPVRVADAGAGTIDEFDIVSNQAINLTGDYTTFVFLMDIVSALNLDDDDWDGYN